MDVFLDRKSSGKPFHLFTLLRCVTSIMFIHQKVKSDKKMRKLFKTTKNYRIPSLLTYANQEKVCSLDDNETISLISANFTYLSEQEVKGKL